MRTPERLAVHDRLLAPYHRCANGGLLELSVLFAGATVLKYRRLGAPATEVYCPAVVEAGSPSSGCRQACFLPQLCRRVRAASLPQRLGVVAVLARRSITPISAFLFAWYSRRVRVLCPRCSFVRTAVLLF